MAGRTTKMKDIHLRVSAVNVCIGFIVIIIYTPQQVGHLIMSAIINALSK